MIERREPRHICLLYVYIMYMHIYVCIMYLVYSALSVGIKLHPAVPPPAGEQCDVPAVEPSARPAVPGADGHQFHQFFHAGQAGHCLLHDQAEVEWLVRVGSEWLTPPGGWRGRGCLGIISPELHSPTCPQHIDVDARAHTHTQHARAFTHTYTHKRACVNC